MTDHAPSDALDVATVTVWRDAAGGWHSRTVTIAGAVGHADADSPGRALELAGIPLDNLEADRLRREALAQDGAPTPTPPDVLGNGATAEEVARVLEVLEDAGYAAAADTIAERAGLELERARLALEQAWTDDALRRIAVAGTGPLWDLKR